MILQTSYKRSFARTAGFAFALCLTVLVVVPWVQGVRPALAESVSTSLLMAVVAGGFAAAGLTPRSLQWDDHSLRIRFLVGKEKIYDWTDLVAWSPHGDGTLMLRFRAEPNIIQIGYAGLADADARRFMAFLKEPHASRLSVSGFPG